MAAVACVRFRSKRSRACMLSRHHSPASVKASSFARRSSVGMVRRGSPRTERVASLLASPEETRTV